VTESSDQSRRATHVDQGAVYAAAGATASPDLLRFPPEGSTAFAHELKIGSGASRFLIASNLLMTWGAQRAAGIVVSDIVQTDRELYSGVVFDGSGVPERAPDLEIRFGSEGEAYLTAGTTATLNWPGARNVSRHVRVVYVIDEARRVGFALGTADDAGAIGETAYVLEHRSDDTVWAIAQGFYRAPDSGFLGLRGRAAVRLAEKSAVEQITTLAPGAAKKAHVEGE
jgi:uncharacterized protein (UPF0548 family)